MKGYLLNLLQFISLLKWVYDKLEEVAQSLGCPVPKPLGF